MKSSALVFHYVRLLYYKGHKTNLNHGESYIDSWLDKKQESNYKSCQYKI